jgi:hypothetical protein
VSSLLPNVSGSNAAVKENNVLSDKAIKILDRPMGKVASVATTVTTIQKMSTELRPDILEAFLGSIDDDATVPKDGALLNPQPAASVERQASDGSGLAALAAAAGVDTSENDTQSSIPSVVMMPMGGMYWPPNAVQQSAQPSQSSGTMTIPSVSHNQRMPSPTKQRVPSPSKAPRDVLKSKPTADARDKKEQTGKPRPQGDIKPKREILKRPTTAAETQAPTSATDSEKAPKDLAKLRKIDLLFTASSNPHQPSVPSDVSDDVELRTANPSAREKDTGREKPKSVMEKLAAAKRSMKKSIDAEKTGADTIKNDEPAELAPVAATILPATVPSASGSAAVEAVMLSVRDLELANTNVVGAGASPCEPSLPAVDVKPSQVPATESVKSKSVLVPSTVLLGKKK